MKHIASCSFGKDSLAMCIKLIEEEWSLDEMLRKFIVEKIEEGRKYHGRN